MLDITIAAYATAKASVRTVGDLRDLIGWLDKYRVPNDTQLDWDRGAVYVMLTNDKETSAAWIECGDHLVGEELYDLLLETHQHEDDK
jgi:hypothetical protein